MGLSIKFNNQDYASLIQKFYGRSHLGGPTSGPQQCFFFKIKSFVFLGILILKIFVLMSKINDFRGDLSGISAKKSSLGSPQIYVATWLGTHC